ncbi:hypothetical protein [Kluyvera genomosp. 1]|uniref:hypothetical protein n=1 Tax=Kluyvera genomosp. 1 TaxID=2774053 RepID=UPI000B156ACD|nr:hypothetical protein [Kluyvera genomosp. 1]
MKPTYEELEAKCQLQQEKLDAINMMMDVIESASDLAKDGIQKLDQQLTESRREFAAANATIHNLELNKAELAAELSAIEAIHNDAVFITDEHYEQCQPAVQKIIGALAVLKIPAYDAYLAEVRARGVEMYAEATIAIGEEEEDEDIVYAGKQALLFAAQLRQGVDYE